MNKALFLILLVFFFSCEKKQLEVPPTKIKEIQEDFNSILTSNNENDLWIMDLTKEIPKDRDFNFYYNTFYEPFLNGFGFYAPTSEFYNPTTILLGLNFKEDYNVSVYSTNIFKNKENNPYKIYGLNTVEFSFLTDNPLSEFNTTTNTQFTYFDYTIDLEKSKKTDYETIFLIANNEKVIVRSTELILYKNVLPFIKAWEMLMVKSISRTDNFTFNYEITKNSVVHSFTTKKSFYFVETYNPFFNIYNVDYTNSKKLYMKRMTKNNKNEFDDFYFTVPPSGTNLEFKINAMTFSFYAEKNNNFTIIGEAVDFDTKESYPLKITGPLPPTTP